MKFSGKARIINVDGEMAKIQSSSCIYKVTLEKCWRLNYESNGRDYLFEKAERKINRDQGMNQDIKTH